MALKTKNDYLKSIKNLDREIYLFGEKVNAPTENPIIKPSINAIAETYKLAEVEDYQNLMITKSSITGKKINRFLHLHQNTEDLVNKVKMLRLLGQKTATCFQRCVGMDAVNALDTVTYEMDQKLSTNYHNNFIRYLEFCQNNDLVMDGAMTDPKGDRSLRPHQQTDPDMFLHVVEKRSDGIVVRGAKVHQTGALNSHEIIVMPTMAMSKEDKDYAVSFAIPSDDDNLMYIYGRQSCDKRKLEEGNLDVGNFKYGGQECIIIFDDVFVPNERIFLNGEHGYAGLLVKRFAGYHRQSYGGCKVGVGDVLIGAAALIAEYNGVSDASHIKNKLTEMIHLNETLYSCGIACSKEGCPMSSGTYLIDLLLANVCKQNVTRFPYEIARLVEDIAGGLMVTMPSEKDLRHPKMGEYIKKYLKANNSIPTENRMQLLRLIENLTLGLSAVSYRTESLHGAGSPQAQKIMIQRQGNLDFKKSLVKDLLDIKS